MKERLHFLLQKMILFISILLITTGAIAQNLIDVSGTITEKSTGSTLIGVTVVEKGTTNGMVSDVNGNYKIKVPAGSVLVFSYVGYITQELIVHDPGVYNVVMEEEISNLNELIVIGYSTQKKTDKTGAVSQIKADELNGGVLTDPIQALQGKAAGVVISKKGGDPNSAFAVRIRGVSGYSANTQPLYVIDGIPNADPSMLSPNDIESYNILKDAASTAIYGSQGSNGVILITTKKGAAEGRKGTRSDGSYSNVEFTTQISIEQVAKKLKLLSASDVRNYVNGLLQEARIKHPNWTADSIFQDGGANTDWQDQIYRKGISTSNTLNISGGAAKNNYFGSINHSYWDGIMRGTSKERTTARLSVSHKAIQDRLTINGNLMTSIENHDLENLDGWDKDDVIYQALSRNPTDPVYNSSGGYYKSSRVFNYENPVSIIDEITNKRTEKKFLGGVKADLEVLRGLVISANLGYTYVDSVSNYFRPANLYASADNGFASKKFDNHNTKLLEVTANYTKTFNTVHNLNILGGYSYQSQDWLGNSMQARNSQSPHSGVDNIQTLEDVVWGDITSYKREAILIGMFGRAQYNYASKYYVSASLRRDGSSRFGENHKWGLFPTAAVGWSIEKEKFMHSVKWLDQLKLRASYGVSGNDKIGEYRSIYYYKPNKLQPNPETGQIVITYDIPWNANPDLKWEETRELNLGLDFAIIHQRISGSVEVYQKKTVDLLGQFPAQSTDLADYTWKNAGSIENRGIEVYLLAFVIDRKNLNWKTSFTAAHNKTKILGLGGDETVRKEGYLSGRGLVGSENYVTGILPGGAAGDFYLPHYVGLLNGQFVYESLTGGFTTDLGQAKRTVVANAAPKIELGWTNNFIFFKRFNLDFAFRSWIGNHMFNATRMFFDSPSILPDLNAVPDALDWKAQGRTSSPQIADIYVEDASFLKLDFISLTYNFNVSTIKWLTNMSIFASANNIFTITGYKGVDPETTVDLLSFGIDLFNVYPKTRSYSVGLRLNF